MWVIHDSGIGEGDRQVLKSMNDIYRIVFISGAKAKRVYSGTEKCDFERKSYRADNQQVVFWGNFTEHAALHKYLYKTVVMVRFCIKLRFTRSHLYPLQACFTHIVSALLPYPDAWLPYG